MSLALTLALKPFIEKWEKNAAYNLAALQGSMSENELRAYLIAGQRDALAAAVELARILEKHG